MAKKFISVICIFAVILGISPAKLAFAADSLNTDFLNINGGTIGIYANPGDKFLIYLQGQNNGTTTLTGVEALLYFTDNSHFSYPGTIYHGIINYDPVPSSAYSTTNGFVVPIDPADNNSAAPGEYPYLYDPSLSPYDQNAQMQINTNISNYTNYAYGSFRGKNAADQTINANVASVPIFVNVNPHITSKYFELTSDSSTTTTIQGSHAQEVNLVLEVKDYNGCTNIDGGTVTADLTDLGLTANESLTYDSCKADGKTVKFKKTGITTDEPLGLISIASNLFTATDEDGNQNDENDSNFAESGETNPATITITAAEAPIVTISNITETTIGGPDKLTTTISYSSSQPGDIGIFRDSCGANGPKNLSPYAPYTNANEVLTFDINSSDLANGDGPNTIYVCNINSGGNLGSFSTVINLDDTAPTISSISHSTAVVTGSATGSFICSEDGEYKLEVTTPSNVTSEVVAYTATTAGATVSFTAPNGLMEIGTNTFTAYCKDGATNVGTDTFDIEKQEPAPDMTGVVTLEDIDSDLSGLDGRDVKITWDTTAGTTSAQFGSYRVYLLPEGIALDKDNHFETYITSDASIGTFTGDETLTTDSEGNALVGGANYKAHVFIIGLSGDKGGAVESAATELVADVVANPVVVSAAFTTDTELKITFDTDIDTDLGAHDVSKISFKTQGPSKSPISITGVTGKTATFEIASLGGDTGITGSTLTIDADSIRSLIGGYNLADSFSGTITDEQAPIITNLTNTSVSPFGGFFKNPITLTYDLSEDVDVFGNVSYIQFARTAGNTDSTIHKSTIVGGEEASGANSKTIALDSTSSNTVVNLTCGTTYNVSAVITDAGGYTGLSNTISGFKFDNCAPNAPTQNELTFIGSISVPLTWNAATDDSGNGSGIKEYTVNTYSDTTCTNLLNTYTTASTTQNVTLVDGTYSWNISATDNMDNVGSVSTCDEFTVDSTVPSISGILTTNTTTTSTEYVKTGDSIELTATIPNSDATKIWADLSSLTGNAGHTSVQCSATGEANITCSYVGDALTYSFPANFGGASTEGTKALSITSQNTSGLNEQTDTTTIKLDLNAPVVDVATITYPNGGETLGGDSVTITWDQTKITDVIGIQKVEVYALNNGGVVETIYSGINTGSTTWDISGYPSGANYSIRVTAFDNVGNTTSDESDSVFALDKVAPSVQTTAIISPNGGEIFSDGETVNITWNTGDITDDVALKTNPIKLEYSIDGSNYTLIAENLANSGSYSWTTPTVNSNTVTVRLTAYDNAGNNASDISDTDFVVDSTAPDLTITFAGGSGTTPQNGKYLNNTGFSVTGTTSDNNFDTLKYTFQNTTDGTYFDGAGYVGVLTENTICTDGQLLGSDSSCNNISENLTPTIEDGKSYVLIVSSTDEAGNRTDYSAVSYTGDTVDPTVGITTLYNSFIGDSLTIEGTSSDSGSGISSVVIQITDSSNNYWDGSSFVGSVQNLATTTTNSYATWSYDISGIPGADNDNFTVTAIASDSAYRTNAESQTSITLVKDANGPVITGGTSLFTSISGNEKLAGGDALNIDWNTGNISDVVSGLADNPIKLEYFNGTTYVLIAENLANSGSYAWTAPSIDYSNVQIRLTATDKAGLTSFQNSNGFSIDSTDPSVLSVETLENGISNGNVNAIVFKMSESISDTSVNINDFVIASGSITPVSFSTGSTADDDTFIIGFNEVTGTGITPTVDYTGSTLSDLSGRKLQTNSFVAQDKATARIKLVEAFDTDANGKLDKIEATFSENLTFTSSFSGLSIDNAFSGMSIALSTVSSDKVILTLNESTSVNSSTDNLSLSLSSTPFTDLAGNATENFSSEVINDKAVPVKISTETLDTDGNSKADTVRLTFSENISGVVQNDFLLNNLSTDSSYSGLTTNGDQIDLELTETSLDYDTDVIPEVVFFGNTLGDASGNILSSIATHNSTDAIVPKLLSKETVDADLDGRVDNIRLTFSESLNDDFSNLNVSVGSYTSTFFTSNIANDGIIFLGLVELETSDTDATPLTQISSNSSLADTAGNLVASESFGSNATDNVGPTVIGARYDEGATGAVDDDQIFLTFSEDVNTGTIDTSTGGTLNDFEISGTGAFSGNSVTTVTGTNTATITMGSGATALVLGSSLVGFKTNRVDDLLGNGSPTAINNNKASLTASIIINEVMFSSNRDDQYIELKNLSSSAVDISGWIIENGGGSGVDLTIPSSQTIAGDGYYLISRANAATSIINTIPDLVDANINLSTSSQNDLVLTDGINILDKAIASPWPYGSSATPKSMERKENAGDGLTTSNWYTAETSSGFDTTIPKGTPGTDNVFDGFAPTITNSFPLDNNLYPAATKVEFDYSDDATGVDTTTHSLILRKWDGASYGSDLAGSEIASQTITNSKATYNLNNLSFGRYRAEFQISDIAGNTVSKTIVFYVDGFEFNVTNSPIHIGELDSNADTFSSGEFIIEVKTVGAGFSLDLTKSGLLSTGAISINDHNGTNGFGFDLYKDENGSVTNYSTSITPISTNTIANVAKDIDINGNRKTYTYRVKFGAKTAGIQSPGKYETTASISASLEY